MAGGLVVNVVGEKMRRSRIRERQQGRALGIVNAQLQAKTEELLAANEELREREQALGVPDAGPPANDAPLEPESTGRAMPSQPL